MWTVSVLTVNKCICLLVKYTWVFKKKERGKTTATNTFFLDWTILNFKIMFFYMLTILLKQIDEEFKLKCTYWYINFWLKKFFKSIFYLNVYLFKDFLWKYWIRVKKHLYRERWLGTLRILFQTDRYVFLIFTTNVYNLLKT